ncbi:hypothetical protein HAX54_016620, partial [Datura stramonium]|nr:hypothetical protein [Datura stramonium]
MVQERELRELKSPTTSEIKIPTPRKKNRRLELRNHPQAFGIVYVGKKKGLKNTSTKALTTIEKEHLKCNIAKDVRIVNSEFHEYPWIEGKYKFYVLGWMCEALGYYYTTMQNFGGWWYDSDYCPQEVHVPILAGIDVQTYATKKYDLEKSKNESIYDMKIHKPFPEYAFIQANFARVVRKVEDKQLKLFAEKLGHFVHRAITTASEPYKNLHAWMYYMDVRKWQPLDFPIARFEELENNVPFIDMLGKKPKTLVTLPPAIEAAPPDHLSAILTTDATFEVSGVTPSQTVVPDDLGHIYMP